MVRTDEPAVAPQGRRVFYEGGAWIPRPTPGGLRAVGYSFWRVAAISENLNLGGQI